MHVMRLSTALPLNGLEHLLPFRNRFAIMKAFFRYLRLGSGADRMHSRNPVYRRIAWSSVDEGICRDVANDMVAKGSGRAIPRSCTRMWPPRGGLLARAFRHIM